MKIFVSYCSKQGDWVWNRLVPVLKAAVGADNVLVDRERFKAGRAVYTQMDEAQDQADCQVLCLSADYYTSAPCRHELTRALAQDPAFADGIIFPIRLDDSPLPDGIAVPDPIWIDMRNDHQPAPWRLLLDGCGGTLGVEATSWLETRESCAYHLNGGRSLVLRIVDGVSSLARDRLIDELKEGRVARLAAIDLGDPRTFSRHGFVRTCSTAFGLDPSRLRQKPPHDLADFTDAIMNLPEPVRVALRSFERVARHKKDFDADFFDTLRWLMEQRRLVLLIDTRVHLADLLPRDHWISNLVLPTIELR